ncbi:MAG: hypothetical protein NC432_05245 [Roseburia sp.]|nr:hypothetical protein [Roseburia sp.]MCM1097913.1 hypothetical protein [Ruminococcus flavefaciens]
MENITEKEFSKLKRRDLLELLLSQIQEDDRLERKGNIMAVRIARQEKSLTRLKEKLDEKDAQIGNLKSKLGEKDEQIEKLKSKLDEKDAQLEKLKRRLDEKDKELAETQETLQAERESRQIDIMEAGSIANAALKLSGIFEAAQDAANRYLENLQARTARAGFTATGEAPPTASETQAAANGETPSTASETQAAANGDAPSTASEAHSTADEPSTAAG